MTGPRQLPVIQEDASSLGSDGRRNAVHPADVKGRFVRLRYAAFAALIGIWAVLPWVPVGGHPAMYLDVEHRRFYLFGATFNSQDVWLSFFVVLGVGLAIMTATVVLGRVWCGWACPQTVFLEGVFRPIERLVEGPRNVRMRRNAGPWTLDKVWRKAVKHLLFVLAALFVTHVFLAFFISMPSLIEMVQRSPAEHPTAFAWMAVVSLLLYGNFAWFREQLCLIVCPYGRMQSILTDRDSLVVGYDRRRGEPRGKAKDPNAGDCVDCGRCVVVCPTGIDIRNGLQLDCIGCTACIDACDGVMDKLGREPGLVRYDSLNGLDGRDKRVLRPRLLLYGAVILVWVGAAGMAFSSHSTFEANLLRMRGSAYRVVDDGASARNLFTLHLVNKGSETATFLITPVEVEGQRFRVGAGSVELPSLGSREVSVYVDADVASLHPRSRAAVEVRRQGDPDGDVQIADAALLGPSR